MKLRMIFIGDEAPRIEFESETRGDFLILNAMSDLHGFLINGFEKSGGWLGGDDWALTLRGNERHGTLKLLPLYRRDDEAAGDEPTASNQERK